MRVISILALNFLALKALGSTPALTLEQALQSALSRNETVSQSREQVNQAEEQFKQARSSVFPSLSFNATHFVQPQPEDPIARQFFPEEQTTANFSLNQPLFRGFREFAGIRQRERNLSATRQNRISQLMDLYLNVAVRYLDILSLEQDIRNLQEQKKIYSDRVNELKARSRRGESRSTESLTAESTLAALEAETRIVESNLLTARENFSFLTDLPRDSVLADTNLQVQTEAARLRPLAEYLQEIENRPDVAQAREQLQAAQEEIKVVRGEHWPTLDLTGNYYVKRPASYLSDLKWDVQLQLTLPLYEGGRIQSQTREALSRRYAQELELKKLRRQAEADIRSLYEILKNRADQIKALERSAQLSERNYKILLNESRRGLSRNVDVQLALTEFRVARRSYDQARFAGLLDRIRLQVATAQIPPVLKKEL